MLQQSKHQWPLDGYQATADRDKRRLGSRSMIKLFQFPRKNLILWEKNPEDIELEKLNESW